jgi:hypothetical protein
MEKMRPDQRSFHSNVRRVLSVHEPAGGAAQTFWSRMVNYRAPVPNHYQQRRMAKKPNPDEM